MAYLWRNLFNLFLEWSSLQSIRFSNRVNAPCYNVFIFSHKVQSNESSDFARTLSLFLPKHIFDQLIYANNHASKLLLLYMNSPDPSFNCCVWILAHRYIAQHLQILWNCNLFHQQTGFIWILVSAWCFRSDLNPIFFCLLLNIFIFACVHQLYSGYSNDRSGSLPIATTATPATIRPGFCHNSVQVY